MRANRGSERIFDFCYSKPAPIGDKGVLALKTRSVAIG